MNKNYKRGYDTERKCMDELTKNGFVCFRTAGSHGVFDVIALKGDCGRLIQLKRTKSIYRTRDKSAEKKINDFKEHMSCTCLLATYLNYFTTEVWIWVDRKGWIKRII